MTLTLPAFRRLVNLSKQEVGAAIYHKYADRISVKKETLAVRNIIKIVDVTLELVHEKCLKTITLRDVSQKAGLSLSTIYSYVRNKEELIHLIQNYGYMMSSRILLNQLQEVSGTIEQLRVTIRTYLLLSEAFGSWFYFCQVETRDMPIGPRYRAIQAELSIDELLCNIIQAGQQKGIFQTTNPALSALLIKALLQEWTLNRWKYDQHRVDVESYIAFIQKTVENHLMPKTLPSYLDHPKVTALSSRHRPATRCVTRTHEECTTERQDH